MFNGSLFLVKDLKGFINNIREKAYNINAGPKTDRAHINLLSNSISQLDYEYRNSLYYHNAYHTSEDSKFSSFRLTRDKFSYINIHNNILGKRWISTHSKIVKKINLSVV